MYFSRRGWLSVIVTSTLAISGPLALHGQESPKKEDSQAPAKVDASRPSKEGATAKEPAAIPPGGLSDESLGTLLEAIGLKPKRNETRYDFTFASKQQDQDWTLSMSAVLSQDKKTIWVMAWLDELPRSSKDVPRTALLSLLSENDRLGKGMFFSYIPANRRFALQQVVENRDMTSKKVRALLLELGQNVSQTYPQWTVSNWKELANPADEDAPAQQASGPGTAKTQIRPATGTK
jgi:hypothetical protein